MGSEGGWGGVELQEDHLALPYGREVCVQGALASVSFSPAPSLTQDGAFRGHGPWESI